MNDSLLDPNKYTRYIDGKEEKTASTEEELRDMLRSMVNKRAYTLDMLSGFTRMPIDKLYRIIYTSVPLYLEDVISIATACGEELKFGVKSDILDEE